MTRKATIDHPETVDAYAISMQERGRCSAKFQIVVRTAGAIGETVRLDPYKVECLLVPDAATHEKPAICFTPAEWLKLRGILALR
jgi:hypothetical protein